MLKAVPLLGGEVLGAKPRGVDFSAIAGRNGHSLILNDFAKFEFNILICSLSNDPKRPIIKSLSSVANLLSRSKEVVLSLFSLILFL